MLRSEVGLGVLVDFVLQSKVNFVHGLGLLTLEGCLEQTLLVVLVHCVAWAHVLVQINAELVVGVHVHLFLQLSSYVLVSIISA